VDNLLLKLGREFPETSSPTPGAWKLTRDGKEEDLSKWKPTTMDGKRPIIIDSVAEEHLPLISTRLVAAQTETWAWTLRMKSFALPTDDPFLLQK
jgi:hypothetical protein